MSAATVPCPAKAVGLPCSTKGGHREGSVALAECRRKAQMTKMKPGLGNGSMIGVKSVLGQKGASNDGPTWYECEEMRKRLLDEDEQERAEIVEQASYSPRSDGTGAMPRFDHDTVWPIIAETETDPAELDRMVQIMQQRPVAGRMQRGVPPNPTEEVGPVVGLRTGKPTNQIGAYGLQVDSATLTARGIADNSHTLPSTLNRLVDDGAMHKQGSPVTKNREGAQGSRMVINRALSNPNIGWDSLIKATTSKGISADGKLVYHKDKAAICNDGDLHNPSNPDVRARAIAVRRFMRARDSGDGVMEREIAHAWKNSSDPRFRKVMSGIARRKLSTGVPKFDEKLIGIMYGTDEHTKGESINSQRKRERSRSVENTGRRAR